MAIDVQCECGRAFAFKNDLAGRSVACPDCGTTLSIPSIFAQADASFDRDRFLLRQKRIAINEIYDVRDEHDASLLYVRRPTYPFRRILAILAGIFVAIAILAASIVVPIEMLGGRDAPNSPLLGFAVLAGTMFAIVAGVATVVGLSPKRHVSFYRDPSRKECVLEVKQDAKFMPVRMTFTVVDPKAGPIGRLSKNLLFDLFRKRWRVNDPDGVPVCTALEDSIILALLRRFLGPLFGLLRTNYLIVRGSDVNGERLGEFNRKLTLFDRYVLDLSADPLRSLDRRLAVALGVMLDTGERR
jgi:hypothetical protein